jgi:hypothetical protein
MSQRNMVKGMGWLQRGSVKGVPVCRVCDEIMVSPLGALSYEQLSNLPPSERQRLMLNHEMRNKLIFIYVAVSAFMLYMGISFFLSI